MSMNLSFMKMNNHGSLFDLLRFRKNQVISKTIVRITVAYCIPRIFKRGGHVQFSVRFQLKSKKKSSSHFFWNWLTFLIISCLFKVVLTKERQKRGGGMAQRSSLNMLVYNKHVNFNSFSVLLGSIILEILHINQAMLNLWIHSFNIDYKFASQDPSHSRCLFLQ